MPTLINLETGRRELASSVHSGVRACGENPQPLAAGLDPPDLGLLGFESDDDLDDDPDDDPCDEVPDEDPDDELRDDPDDDPGDDVLGVLVAGAAAVLEESELAESAFGALDDSEVDSELVEPESVDEDPPSDDDVAPTAAVFLLSVR